jgi:Amt family ammonium transporter
MTIPGVALFYGGMARKKNVLSVLMQSFAITCLISIIWMIVGYSLAFSKAESSYIGNLDFSFLAHLNPESLNGSIPDSLFVIFQMTFAIITAALITGALAERIKFSALLWFVGLWSIAVYSPVTFWVWGGGYLGDAGVLDFAGGTAGALEGNISQIGIQIYGIFATIVWSAIATAIIILIIDKVIGIRVDHDSESEGLDISQHGEVIQ